MGLYPKKGGGVPAPAIYGLINGFTGKAKGPLLIGKFRLLQ